jgi:hypothetical protein
VVHYDLVIPDYTKGKLGMTGLVLTVPSAVQMATPRADTALQKILPTPPTTERAFDASDTLNVYAEIYDNAPQPAHELDIVTTVTTAAGPPVFSSHTMPSIAETASVKLPFAAQVPLKGFAPGTYVLRVEVRSRVSGASVLRQVPVVVR